MVLWVSDETRLGYRMTKRLSIRINLSPLDFTGFYRFLKCFIGCNGVAVRWGWLKLGFTGLGCVLLSFIGCYFYNVIEILMASLAINMEIEFFLKQPLSLSTDRPTDRQAKGISIYRCGRTTFRLRGAINISERPQKHACFFPTFFGDLPLYFVAAACYTDATRRKKYVHKKAKRVRECLCVCVFVSVLVRACVFEIHNKFWLKMKKGKQKCIGNYERYWMGWESEYGMGGRGNAHRRTKTQTVLTLYV